jgi:hypothetical protein
MSDLKVKKSFEELYNILKANKDKKVSSVLEQLMPLLESKSVEQPYILNKDGELLAIKDSYFKVWILKSENEIGKKIHSPTGYNSFCKTGINAWTKRNAKAKLLKAEQELALSNENFSLYKEKKVEHENLLKSIDFGLIRGKYATASREDCVKHLEEQGHIIKTNNS